RHKKIAMKQILSLFVSIAALGFASCDYVAEPNQSNSGQGGGPGVQRKVLVEEFTGHTCPTCPAAAVTLHALDELYGDRLIAIAVHTGFFARPCPPASLPSGAPSGSFSEDLNSTEGNDYDAVFQLSNAPPVGMVNRLGFPTNTHGKPAGDWGGIIDSLLNEAPIASMEISREYNSSTRALNVSIDGRFLQDLNGTYKTTILIVEDSLVGWQQDGSSYIPDYEWEHVLRGCVNTPGSIAGALSSSGAITAQATFGHVYTNYIVNANWNAAHCKIVAILYDDLTKEVLQAEEVDLIP
ncbi:MAG: Omp28-related outer membrane protein, partial [Bacteroidia bacterium]